MTTVTMAEAQVKLRELIQQLAPGEELVILENDKPVAKLIGERPERRPRKAGNCKGMIVLAVEDDEHLRDFAEYMP